MTWFTTLLIVLSLAVSTDPSIGEQWRGIVPLQSTRADVERLPGPASNECKSTYYLDDVNLFFLYASSGECNAGSGAWNVPPDTVILFSVIPKLKPRLSDLNLDQTRFKEKPTHIEGSMYL
jgi:hypothetical protein